MQSGPLKILVADDEPAILRGTEIMLKNLGFDVDTVETVKEIVPALRELRPDVLLQDVRMPGLDIDKHVASLRADASFSSLRILLFSADLALVQTATRVRADGYLEKPFQPEALKRSIAALA